MPLPKYCLALTYVNEDGTAGFPQNHIVKVLALVKKYFTNYDFVVEYGVNGSNRHFHCIMDCTRRVDKIRDLFKPLYPSCPGLETPQKYYKRKIMCTLNRYPLSRSLTYHRKETIEDSPYIDPKTGNGPKYNTQSEVLATTFSPNEIAANLLLYTPSNNNNPIQLKEFFRTKPKPIAKDWLIHTLDAYASEYYPGHDDCLTRTEFANMIQRMTMEGYVLYYHIKNPIFRWLNAMRDDKEAIQHILCQEEGSCPHCHACL